jgi:hypothetical protein
VSDFPTGDNGVLDRVAKVDQDGVGPAVIGRNVRSAPQRMPHRRPMLRPRQRVQRNFLNRQDVLKETRGTDKSCGS